MTVVSGFHLLSSAFSWYLTATGGIIMDETFQAKWRNAVLGLCLTAVVFGVGWAVAFY